MILRGGEIDDEASGVFLIKRNFRTLLLLVLFIHLPSDVFIKFCYINISASVVVSGG